MDLIMESSSTSTTGLQEFEKDTLFSSQNIAQHRFPQVRRMEMESIAVSMFLR